MVLNKPSGLPVQGGEGVKSSLDSILSEKYQDRPLLVHRLDKDTSGLILVAKTREAARFFSVLFDGGERGKEKKDRPLVKQYLGVCSGVPEPEQGVIRLSLTERGKGPVKIIKESETFYRILSIGEACDIRLSFLELELGTGRMHQIRRHLAAIGHPLLGDDKYGDFPLNKKLKATLRLKSLLLHASRLVISPCQPLPDGLDLTAPLPDSWRQIKCAIQ